MHASVNVGCQGKSGPGRIHEVIPVTGSFCLQKRSYENLFNVEHFCDKLLSTSGQNSKNNTGNTVRDYFKDTATPHSLNAAIRL